MAKHVITSENCPSTPLSNQLNGLSHAIDFQLGLIDDIEGHLPAADQRRLDDSLSALTDVLQRESERFKD